MEFINDFFKEAFEVINFHNKQIKEYNLQKPSINYIDLFDFLQSAMNFLYEIDPDTIVGLPVKLYKDIESLIQYYKHIKKVNPSHIFYNIYLPSLPAYKKLKKEINEYNQKISQYKKTLDTTTKELKKYKQIPKDLEELKTYKLLKKKNVDAIYYIGLYKEKLEEATKKINLIEKEEEKKFFSTFEKTREEVLSKLKDIINTKLYYFDKLIWYNASNSSKVRKFFKDSNINDEISSKTFLKYQLQHIDESLSLKGQWISYLKSLLKVLN